MKCLIVAEDSVKILILKRKLVVDALKGKAIQEYDKLLRELRKGKKPKYDDLMNLICYIDLPVELDHDSIT